MTTARVDRTPHTFQTAGGPRFAWLHQATDAPALDAIAVICPPIGPEDTRSHRSIRHLADAFAAAGIAALRFDYHGSGDSPGSDVDPERVETWTADIVAAVRHATAISGGRPVVLVGLRLGATLAWLASRTAGVDGLVLWNALATGRPFIRELKVMASTAEIVAATPHGGLEGGGYAMSPETVAAVAALDVTNLPPSARRIMVLQRDDLPADRALAAALQHHPAVETIPMQGWTDMVADNHFSRVPHAALEAIVAWAREGLAAAASQSPIVIPAQARGAWTAEGVEETPLRYGPEERLFGILARRDADPSRIAVVVFNAGSVHHVGPHRVVVDMARLLAQRGCAVLRCDLTGIGDSVADDRGRENHPYPDTAVEDALTSMRMLRERFGYRTFVPMGLCSGAHTAFHAALAADDITVATAVLINPLTFEYVEGMSVATTRRINAVRGYRTSARSWRRWMQVLRGDVSLRGPIRATTEHGLEALRFATRSLLERINPAWASPLSVRLRALFARRIPLRLVIAEGDPGAEILHSQARRAVVRGEREGLLAITFIADADHTFSQSGARAQMFARVAEIVDGLRATPVPARPASPRPG